MGTPTTRRRWAPDRTTGARSRPRRAAGLRRPVRTPPGGFRLGRRPSRTRSAASSASSPPATTSRASPTSASSPSSTAARRARASPSRTADGIRCHKEMGLVTQVFDEDDLASLRGDRGDRPHPLLHHRLQHPLQRPADPGRDAARRRSRSRTTATSSTRRQLRSELEAEGIRFETTNDSEVIARCIASLHRGEHRGRGARDDAARAGRLLRRGAHRGRARRLPRPERHPPALPRHAERRTARSSPRRRAR